jgi:excisionase family DNA binding protein
MRTLVLPFAFLLALSLGAFALPSLAVNDIGTAIPLAATAAIPLAATAATIEPIFVSIAAAAEILATSRSEIYQRIARGELQAVKDGARTKITFESVKRAAAALPKATVRLYVRPPRRTPAT